ncbi:MAG: acetyl-CoA carboxylase biotin carboxyl carrier protein subunit [Micromonosporaceae bacterium]|nr:acetyl-CoA carboxylase biotin carboxyl carrier protein subunit [Micromonosporaceae bacterium]
MTEGLSREDVQEIIGLLDDVRGTELRVRTRHFELWLRRNGTGDWVQSSTALAPPRLAEPVAPAPAVAPPAAPAAPVADDSTVDGLVPVRAALMGTFYRAPKPGADPFVEVGSRVTDQSVVGILETMKLMNSVYAGTTGRIAEICVANAEYAAQGTVLMRIEPEPGE